MISESELFIIFGSSLGKTDKWWWRHILATIYKGSQLIIYAYKKEYESTGPIEESLRTQFIRDNFDSTLFGGRSLNDPSVLLKLKENIHVVVYKDPSTLSAFGFGKDLVPPWSRDPELIPPVI